MYRLLITNLNNNIESLKTKNFGKFVTFGDQETEKKWRSETWVVHDLGPSSRITRATYYYRPPGYKTLKKDKT